MADLIDDVQNRYGLDGGQALIELTNPRDPAASSIDTTVLQRACDDIESGEFRTYAQQAYDSTDRQHVNVACEGVVAILMKWGASARNLQRIEWGDWVARCRDLAAVSSRGRIEPSTSSELTPSDEVQGGETRRPWSDPENFEGLVPGLRGGDDNA